MRKRIITAASIKPLRIRCEYLWHAFEDEYVHLAWGADLGLAEMYAPHREAVGTGADSCT